MWHPTLWSIGVWLTFQTSRTSARSSSSMGSLMGPRGGLVITAVDSLVPTGVLGRSAVSCAICFVLVNGGLMHREGSVAF